MQRAYVTAFIEVLKPTDVETALAGLRTVLSERGHERLLAPVLRAVVRELEATRPTTIVTIAKQADEARQEERLKNLLSELGATEHPTIVVDDTLIGGMIVEHNHVRVDESYKRALVTLYRSLTA